MTGNIKELRFWFSTGETMDRIAVELKKHGVIQKYGSDFENVYEWFVASTAIPGITLNVSRKHNNGEAVSGEPVTVLLMYDREEPGDGEVEGLAERFGRALDVEVCLGRVEYLGGDDYLYHERMRIPRR